MPGETTVYTYAQTGIRTVRQTEEIDDRLFAVSPQEAILQNAAGMGAELNTPFWAWQLIDFEQPTATNFEAIDDEAASFYTKHAVLMGNFVYEDFEGVKTGLAARKIKRYESQGDVHAEQLSYAHALLIKRQELNLTFGEFNAASAGNPAQTEGLFPFIFKSGRSRQQGVDTTVGSSTLDDIYGSYVKFMASGSAFTETVLYDTLQESYMLGNDISRNIALVPPSQRKKFNDFVRIYSPSATEQSQLRYFRNVDEQMAGITVEFFKTEFGTIGLVSWRVLDTYASTYTIPDINSSGTVTVTPSECILGFDPSFVEVRPFMDYTYVELANASGANEVGQIQCIFGLQVNNPKACWGIQNLNGT